MLTEHKRVKIGQLPGQVNLGYLIAMREHRRERTPDGLCIEVFPWQHLDERDAAGLRRHMKAKARKVQRRRDRRAAQVGLVER